MGDESDLQAEGWELLFDRLRGLLSEFGTENVAQTADCWVDDDNIGTFQQKAYFRNLALLRPQVIKALQNLLTEFPGWEIMIAVSVPGQGETWPDMGLTIRPHEIVDGLRREYFPAEFQHFQYEGSRPGTDLD